MLNQVNLTERVIPKLSSIRNLVPQINWCQERLKLFSGKNLNRVAINHRYAMMEGGGRAGERGRENVSDL